MEKKWYVLNVLVDEVQKDQVVVDGKVIYSYRRHEFDSMNCYGTLKEVKREAMKWYGKKLWPCDTLEVKEQGWEKYVQWLKPYKKPWRVIRYTPQTY